MKFGVNTCANTPYPVITGVRKELSWNTNVNHESSVGDVETSYFNR